MNKDLELLATMALAFIATEGDRLSEDSIESLQDLISQELNGEVLLDEWNNDDVVVEFIKALNNLKEVTESYNDLEYEEDVQ